MHSNCLVRLFCRQVADNFLADLIRLQSSLLNKGDFGFCISSNVGFSRRSCNSSASQSEFDKVVPWRGHMMTTLLLVNMLLLLHSKAHAFEWMWAPHRGYSSSQQALRGSHHLLIMISPRHFLSHDYYLMWESVFPKKTTTDDDHQECCFQWWNLICLHPPGVRSLMAPPLKSARSSSSKHHGCAWKNAGSSTASALRPGNHRE